MSDDVPAPPTLDPSAMWLLPDPDIATEARREASFNAVAIASVSWQQAVITLAHILGLARRYGLSDAEITRASGLSARGVDELTDAVKAALAPKVGD